MGMMRLSCALLLPGLLLTACSGTLPGPVVPVALRPVSSAQVEAWVAQTRLTERRLTRFSWLFQNERQEAVGGKGAAQIAIPDSLRFDFRGALGAGRGAAVVIGDTALWAQPEDQVQKLVPNYPLLWAMFGVARGPHVGDELSGIDNAQLTAWRYVNGTDTVEYVRSKGKPMQLVADVRRGPERIGRVVTTFDDQGRPTKARLDVPTRPVRLTLTFTLVSTPKPFDPEIWRESIDN